MSVPLLMDHQVRYVVTASLRRRGFDVLTAEEDGSEKLPDPELLDRAMMLGRVLVTQDEHFLAESTRRIRAGIPYVGIVYVKQQRLSDRGIVDELELLAGATDLAEWQSRLEFLPLK